MSDGEKAAAIYNAMAADYTADNDENIYNAAYERPAMIAMLGDLDGLRVLDLGCGAGQLSVELIAAGATVTGIDVSAAMVDIARERLGAETAIAVGDIGDPLPFQTGAFDVVVSSLTMHYVEDWVPTLAEIRRVLAPSGRFTFSTHHPTMDFTRHSPDDYFAKKPVTETWTRAGKPYDVTFWRRTLADMSWALHRAGFVIDLLHEPQATDALAERDPTEHEYLSTHPHYLFVRALPKTATARLPTLR